MASGIRDKVAILGMGCSKFGERWDRGAGRPDGRGVRRSARRMRASSAMRIEAAWLGVFFDEQSIGKSPLPLSMALRLPNIPVTRVENLCATGTEALRGAVYAVAAGACDIALAMGVEKLKDTGYAGLPERTKGTFEDLYLPGSTAPGAFAQLASAYAAKYGYSMDDLKQAMAHVSWKSHENGSRNPKAHLRNRVTEEQILAAPTIAYPLGTYDCCGVSDGAACAIVTTPAIARELGKRDLVTDQGSAAGAEQRRGDGAQILGWQPHAHHADRREARVCGSRHPRSAQGDRPHRGARLLLHHRARADGGSRALRSRAARRTTFATADTIATARFPARSTAASNASAIRSAPPACAWRTRSICSCSAAPASGSFPARPSGSHTTSAAFRTATSRALRCSGCTSPELRRHSNEPDPAHADSPRPARCAVAARLGHAQPAHRLRHVRRSVRATPRRCSIS